MFHFDKNFGLFIGKLTDNKFHKHYASQISVSCQHKMTVSLKDENVIAGNAFLIPSKIEHKLISNTNQLTILVNPLSSVGHQLWLKFGRQGNLELDDTLSKPFVKLLGQYEQNSLEFNELCQSVSEVLNAFQCSCELENHVQDNRILNALKFMDENFDKVLSVEEVSAQCFLSPTRFLHLFKEKTNLTFRRYQLWNKLVNSLPDLMNNSITNTAHMYGFSDSSHYTRTFIETFGVTPKFIALAQ